ncbi:MAG: peptidyl-prolyl cis-trans isomerase [Thermoguttaceae bacterium]|nr:peptidyl-prolyl cis-trans isomerase [Thermoguttaceae bacterium]
MALLKNFVFTLGLAGLLLIIPPVHGQQKDRTGNPVYKVAQNVANNNPIKQPVKNLYPDIVAEVNGEKITKEQLMQESLRAHGEEVLSRILNRTLVLSECRRQGINITRTEVDAEIDRLAKTVRTDREQYLQLIMNESKMDYQSYAEEVIWPRLALQALVADKIQVSDEELDREFLKTFGPSVNLQLIVTDTEEKANQLREQAIADPASFGDLAKKESIDVATASNKGRMQPVFHYTLSDQELEQKLFALPVDGISEVIGPYGPQKQFMIFKCENKNDPRIPEDKKESVRDQLKFKASSEKLRGAADELFAKLGKEANVVNVISNPELRSQYPGVAALINGQSISLDAVVDMCLDLYAAQDLEKLISMTLIRQECKKVQLTISEGDIDTDIWIHAAETTFPLKDGSPNIKEYMANELKKYNCTEAVYRSDIVWPSLALKKLSEGLVKITDEDIQKSFEANYGSQVQCLGIVVGDERRARDVWQKARTLPEKNGESVEKVFGDLAAEYSTEPDSRQMRGHMPPIIKNGGYPKLEDEAFSLKPGDLSSVIQIDPSTFVILYCQEIIPPKDVTLDDVRDEITSNLRKMKEAYAVNDYFNDVLKRSTIINHLNNEVRTPNQPAPNPAPNPASDAASGR